MSVLYRRKPEVLWNMPQGLDGTEKLQARNNIGAAALASLAAPFESRAPSYAWSAGEVCTYGGALWMFDINHSGAWTGADAHEVTILEVLANMSEKPTTILSAPIYIGGDPTDLDIYTYANNARTASVTFSALCELAFTPNGGADLDEVSFDKTKVLKIKRARIKTPGSVGLGAANGKKCATLYMSTGYYGTPPVAATSFAMQFSAFDEWEEFNLSVDSTSFGMSTYKMAIKTTDGNGNDSTITIDDYNMQSAYEGQKLQAWLEIEVESEGIATT
jgi:hypothetical protein